MIKNTIQKESGRLFLAILGTFIFAIGVNIFIVPVGLYSGGFLGIGQIIRTILVKYMHLSFGNFDVAGTIYFIFNIPLFVLAYKKMGKKFFTKTVICVIFQTVFLTVIVSPKIPIISDVLTACLIGGIIAGFGTGLTLLSGGSGGGQDILGVYYIKKYNDFSVGKLTLIINLFVYGICAIMFDLQIVIYSVIYTTFLSIIVDKIHYQNINITAIIFSKKDDLQQVIIDELDRGATYWDGIGAYTKEKSTIIFTVISKYEVSELKRVIEEKDPNAFIIFNEGISVYGNFLKRL